MVSAAVFDLLGSADCPSLSGLYGFDVRGPAIFRTHYWANVLSVLRQKVGADVIVTGVPGCICSFMCSVPVSYISPLRTGSIASRAESLDRLLKDRVAGRGINFMAHSMGGLDCRHLISRIKPTNYTPVSLTTVGTPHRGSPFMDWCTASLFRTLQYMISEFKCRTTWASGSWQRKEGSRPVCSRRCVPRSPV